MGSGILAFTPGTRAPLSMSVPIVTAGTSQEYASWIWVAKADSSPLGAGDEVGAAWAAGASAVGASVAGAASAASTWVRSVSAVARAASACWVSASAVAAGASAAELPFASS